MYKEDWKKLLSPSSGMYLLSVQNVVFGQPNLPIPGFNLTSFYDCTFLNQISWSKSFSVNASYLGVGERWEHIPPEFFGHLISNPEMEL